MAKNKDPQTIFERLKEGPGLAPTINPRSVSSFNWARTGEVGFDRAAGQQWKQLGAILADYDPAIRTLIRTETERKIMEDANDASLFLTENPELTANMKAWEQASKDNEDIRNMNPYVKKAIVRGVLRNTAIQAEAELEDWYVTSGEVNNADTASVYKNIQGKAKEIAKNLGVGSVPASDGQQQQLFDAIDIGENYTLFVNNGISRLMEKHNRNVESQNSKKLALQYNKDFYDLTRNWMTSPSGFLDPHHPNDEGRLITTSIEWLNNEAERLKSLGFKEAEVIGMQAEAVLQSALPAATKKRLAEQMHATVNGKQIPLISQPGVAKVLDDLEEREEDKRWQRLQRAHTQAVWSRENAQMNAIRMGYQYMMDHKDEPIDVTEAFNKLGIDPLHFAVFKSSLENAQNSLAVAPDNLINLSTYELDYRLGKIGKGDIYGLIRDGNSLSPTQTQALLTLISSSETEEQNNINTIIKEARANYITFGLNVNKEEAQKLLNDWDQTGKAPQIPGALDIFQKLPGYLEDFHNEINMKKAEKEGGNRTLTETELLKLRSEFESTRLPKLASDMQMPTQQKKEARQNTSQLHQFAQEVQQADTNFWEAGSLYTARQRLSADMRNNLAMLFPQMTQDDWTGLRAASPQDYLAFMVAHGGLSTSNLVYLFEGRYPEELGLNSSQQIINHLTDKLRDSGYIFDKKTKLSPDAAEQLRK